MPSLSLKLDTRHHVTAAELRELLRQTGFVVAIALEPHTGDHATAEAAIEFFQASSFGNFLGHLPESLQASARRDIAEELEALRTPQGIPQLGQRIVATAVKESS